MGVWAEGRIGELLVLGVKVKCSQAWWVHVGLSYNTWMFSVHRLECFLVAVIMILACTRRWRVQETLLPQPSLVVQFVNCSSEVKLLLVCFPDFELKLDTTFEFTQFHGFNLISFQTICSLSWPPLFFVWAAKNIVRCCLGLGCSIFNHACPSNQGDTGIYTKRK